MKGFLSKQGSKSADLATLTRNDKSLASQRSDLASGLSAIRGSEKVFNEEEGEEDYWVEIDVSKLRIRELRAALEARGLSTVGGKRQLQARLQQSVHEEKEEELEYMAMVEATRRAEAALEESGSVYTVGLNRKGQLGLGDREDRRQFEVVKELRGKGVVQVCAGGDIAMALAENGNVFTWGGIGTGIAKPKPKKKPDDEGRRRSRRKRKEAATEIESDDILMSPILAAGEDGLCQPHLLETLQGEGINYIATGPNHSGAISDSGDMYVWGDGTRGQLGTGKFTIETTPALLETLEEGTIVKQLSIGQTHSMIMLEDEDQVFSFGFSNSGKLGLGYTERKGVKPPLNKYFPEPTIIPGLLKKRVQRIICSANHSGVLTEEGLYTWGSGDGGRLGHGDHKDRFEPCFVEALRNHILIDVSFGFWHSAAIVQVPPLANGGWLYTWGSGYHGQLASGDTSCFTVPTISEVCVDMRLLFIKLSCGPTHCVAMTCDGDLYSWGSNKHGELAREMEYQEDVEREYTPIPGFIAGFNTLVNRVGRGNVRSFACGKEFTVVATSKYVGESEEEMKLREQEERENELEEAQQLAIEEEIRRREAEDEEEKSDQVDLLQYNGQGCDMCSGCPGFDAHVFHPNQCKECGHNRRDHNLPKRTGASFDSEISET